MAEIRVDKALEGLEIAIPMLAESRCCHLKVYLHVSSACRVLRYSHLKSSHFIVRPLEALQQVRFLQLASHFIETTNWYPAQCFFSPSASLRNFLSVRISSMSNSQDRLADRVAVRRKRIRNVLDEVLLAPAGGLDRRRLLDSLGAAAAEESNATEHRAEDTHGELLYAISQPIFQFFHAIACADVRSVCHSVSCCSSFPRRKVLWSWELTYVVRADLAEHGELVVDDHICGWYV
jgi:hypothetical protein